MCRHFPSGTRIVKLEGDWPEGVAGTAGILPDGSCAVALVNWGEKDRPVRLQVPVPTEAYSLTTFGTALEKKRVPDTFFILPAQTFAIFAKE